MNRQEGPGRIEWTDYTWNPIGGCQHGCAWRMPDGSVANCYAEDVANGIARLAYPDGFEAHYWRPSVLTDPLSIKSPVRIFCGSMADVFGHWVPTAQIQQVLDACRKAERHTFQFLTKNPPRLKQFDFPPNCWVGVSAPPSQMMGKRLTPAQQCRWFYVAVSALARCNARIKWVSFEPLSFDIADEMSGEGWEDLARVINWAVIGGASNGKRHYQPDPEWVTNLVDLLDCQESPVFFKGNLRGNLAAIAWREEFPEVAHG
jgi:protein gp37